MNYIVGHYMYREMRRPAITAARYQKRSDIDCLPPTMLNCMVQVEAANQREAIKIFKANPQYCNNHR